MQASPLADAEPNYVEAEEKEARLDDAPASALVRHAAV